MWSYLGFEENKGIERFWSKRTAWTGNSTDMEEQPIEAALECDYERDCTPLYKNVEQENWDAVAKFLQTGYWPGSFFADSIPPADQVRTWVTRFDPKEPERVRWSQLPLHLAIVVEAPYEIIGSMIELYPQSVRCTDDQQMLPLHLAMRHGSPDNVVDLLLAAFPDAVNAKGKNDRTPIECAIRGPNKSRGRILETFVEKAKAKATKSLKSNYSREIAALRAKLQDKEYEIDSFKSKVAEVDSAKAALQRDITKMDAKVSDQETASDHDILTKISELEQQKIDLQNAQEKARAEEKMLIQELEVVHAQLAKSLSPEDLDALKDEIDAFKSMRVNTAQERAKKEVEDMKKHIENELQKTDGTNKEVLQVMKNNIEELHRMASLDSADGDLTTLQGEIEQLREELRAKEETSKLKVEIALIKEEMTKDLKDSATKTKEQLATMQEAISSLNMSDLDKKTNAELTALKTELETLKVDVNEPRLADKMIEDVVNLRIRVDELGEPAFGKSRQDVVMIKKTLDGIKIAELHTKSDEELMTISNDIRVLTELLKEIEQGARLRAELTTLKKQLESDLKDVKSSGKGGTAPLKVAIQKLQRIDSKSTAELVALKYELDSVNEQVKLKQEWREIVVSTNLLKAETNKHFSMASGNNKEEFSAIKKALDDMEVKKIDPSSSEEVNGAKSELSRVRKWLADQELAFMLKAELGELSKSFKDCSQDRKSEKAEAEWKKMIEKLNKDEIDGKTTQELIAIKDVAKVMMYEHKEKDQVWRDLGIIKHTLDGLLSNRMGKVKDDLLSMKQAVDFIDPHELDINKKEEWDDLKSQIAILKKELADADIARKTTQDLVNLREALDSAIEHAQGSAKDELVTMKAAVAAIDISKFEFGKIEQWEALKTEIEGMKKSMKALECKALINTVKDELKNESISKIEVSRATRRLSMLEKDFEGKSYTELVGMKLELETMLSDLPKDGQSKSFAQSLTQTLTQHVRDVLSPRQSTRSVLGNSTISSQVKRSPSPSVSSESSNRKKFFARIKRSIKGGKDGDSSGADKDGTISEATSVRKPESNAEGTVLKSTDDQEGSIVASEDASTNSASKPLRTKLFGRISQNPSKNQDDGSQSVASEKVIQTGVVPSSDDGEAEEKKEEHEEPRSLPPLYPGKIPRNKTQENPEQVEDETPSLKLTLSKAVDSPSPEGEIETVAL